MPDFHLTRSQASRLRAVVKVHKKWIKDYKKVGWKSWEQWQDDDLLWLRVLSQIVVAGNAAPGEVLMKSRAVKEILGFGNLKKLNKGDRRNQIFGVLKAIGTRYVGEGVRKPKVDAAMRNFETLDKFGGPRKFFADVHRKPESERLAYILGLNKEKRLAYFNKKGARDILIELRLVRDRIAIDQRIANILQRVCGRMPPINREFDTIETELIERVAWPCGITGGELDRILFRNYGDIMVRLTCS